MKIFSRLLAGTKRAEILASCTAAPIAGKLSSGCGRSLIPRLAFCNLNWLPNAFPANLLGATESTLTSKPGRFTAVEPYGGRLGAGAVLSLDDEYAE